MENFQNNMQYLSAYADDIQQKFTTFNQERINIQVAMQSMQDHGNALKSNSYILNNNLELLQ